MLSGIDAYCFPDVGGIITPMWAYIVYYAICEDVHAASRIMPDNPKLLRTQKRRTHQLRGRLQRVLMPNSLSPVCSEVRATGRRREGILVGRRMDRY